MLRPFWGGPFHHIGKFRPGFVFLETALILSSRLSVDLGYHIVAVYVLGFQQTPTQLLSQKRKMNTSRMFDAAK